MTFNLLSKFISTIKNKINKIIIKKEEEILTPTELSTNFIKFK